MTKAKKETSKMKNADDIIVKMEAEKLGKVIDTPKPETNKEVKLEQAPLEEVSANTEEKLVSEVEPEKNMEDQSEKVSELTENNIASEPTQDEDIDEYGTKVTKKKLYSEEEVQRMIRDRLKRGQHAETTHQQAQDIQNAAKDFKADPASSESWEVQLEQFVENTIHKISKKHIEQEWKEKESKSQAEFEVKFTQGMSKYEDFQDVVSNKPITNAMMLATRSMKDPAAFIYAAAKQHPKELERIAQIPDAVTQATEIGRLEERMKKTKVLPSTHKPLPKVNGDVSHDMPEVGIDQRIAEHAKTKIMRR